MILPFFFPCFLGPCKHACINAGYPFSSMVGNLSQLEGTSRHRCHWCALPRVIVHGFDQTLCVDDTIASQPVLLHTWLMRDWGFSSQIGATSVQSSPRVETSVMSTGTPSRPLRMAVPRMLIVTLEIRGARSSNTTWMGDLIATGRSSWHKGWKDVGICGSISNNGNLP